jgi:hypothetical protein
VHPTFSNNTKKYSSTKILNNELHKFKKVDKWLRLFSASIGFISVDWLQMVLNRPNNCFSGWKLPLNFFISKFDQFKLILVFCFRAFGLNKLFMGEKLLFLGNLIVI